MKYYGLIPMGLLLSLSAKSLVFGFTTQDTLVCVALIAFVFGTDLLSKQPKIQEVKEQYLKDISHIKEVVGEQNKVIEAMAKEVDSVRTSVIGVKLQSNIRSSKLG